ncbi:hypothetical protein [Culicoidibacter larvae]|uniref:Uncharacterized protein n=1 Tax=Culicoidibacter larvae TaxID=2579976 RepID=A0A5R8QFI2_9FIRM|nr:hypothetical protein [Culicoidibacter larvae]TLG76801.1 hypothetical protein FEZ08_04070 [Culicoidibacter larvae]
MMIVSIDAVQPLIGLVVDMPMGVDGDEPVLRRLRQEFEACGLSEMQESFIALHTEYDLNQAKKQVVFAVQTDDYSSATHVIGKGRYVQYSGVGDFWVLREQLWAKAEAEVSDAERGYTSDFEVYYADGSRRFELYIALKNEESWYE